VKLDDQGALLESERDARVQGLNEHSTKLEDLARLLEGVQDELAASREQHMAALKELSAAHSKATEAHSQSCRQLELRIGAENQNSKCLVTLCLERHDAKIARLDALIAGDRDVGEKRWKTVESLVQDLESELEAGLRTVEASVGNFTSALRSVHEQIDDGLAGLRQKIDDNHLLNGKHNQLRSGRKERGAVERVHDEHVGCFHFDDGVHLMQVAEVRRTFGEVNMSQYRSEISNIVQEWQSLKKKFVTQLQLPLP